MVIAVLLCCKQTQYHTCATQLRTLRSRRDEDVQSPSKSCFSLTSVRIMRYSRAVWSLFKEENTWVCWPVGSKSLRVPVWPLLLSARSVEQRSTRWRSDALRVGTMKKRCLRSRKKFWKRASLESERNYINRTWILGLMMTLAVSFEGDDVLVNGKFEAIDFVCHLIFYAFASWFQLFSLLD